MIKDRDYDCAVIVVGVLHIVVAKLIGMPSDEYIAQIDGNAQTWVR